LSDIRCRVCGGEWKGFGTVCDKCVAYSFEERGFIELLDNVKTMDEALDLLLQTVTKIKKLREV
jgi:hypothetical protein